MRKLQRSDPSIEFVRLLASHAKRWRLAKYDDNARTMLGDAVRDGLAAAPAGHRVRGLRAEALFSAVVTSIGSVSFMKEEDTGEVHFTGDDVLVPDFRLVTTDGTQLLIEVKVATMQGLKKPSFSLSDGYVCKLRRYCEMTGAPLRFAIFWEDLRIWTLNRPEAFAPGTSGVRQWRISFEKAYAANEMNLVGDYIIATPPPLRFRILIDQEKSDVIPAHTAGEYEVTLAGIQLLSQDRLLSGVAAEIAAKLLWYGTWDTLYEDQHQEDGRVLWIDHVVAPPDWEACAGEAGSSPTEPAVIATLAGMISSAYLQGATETVHTNSNSEILRPGSLRNFIPDNFTSLNLAIPLCIMHVQANFDFKETVCCG